MMKLLGALVLPLVLTSNLLAGPDEIIKQHAKELVNQNNVRQGIAPPTQAPQPGAPNAATPQAPAQSPALIQLKVDLAAIKTSTPATAAQKQKLASDILAVAQTSKPTAAAAAKWAEDVTEALSQKQLSIDSRSRMVQELDAVLNPSKYPQAKMQGIFDDIQAIFQENGLDRRHSIVISEDVKGLTAR